MPSDDRIARLPITLERDEDGVWVAECPSIPGCISQGATEEEAIANVRDAAQLCLEVRMERGMALPSFD
jgi:predicted RNase H-like HicB family nuclease